MTNKIQTKLTQATLTAWIEALKSAKYSRGYSYLGKIKNDVPCHCALGVLCEILNVPRTVDQSGLYRYGIDGEETQASDLPDSVCELTGISKRGDLAYRVQHNEVKTNNIACLNDCGVPFDQIAKHIEEHFLAA
jgi:hypothetical protein